MFANTKITVWPFAVLVTKAKHRKEQTSQHVNTASCEEREWIQRIESLKIVIHSFLRDPEYGCFQVLRGLSEWYEDRCLIY